jgi:polyisoprenoid-binding protein YceI
LFLIFVSNKKIETMKKTIFLAASVAFLAACNTPDGDKIETGAKQEVAQTEGSTTYRIDSNSVVTWTGSKPTGSHTGTFNLKEGSLLVKDNTVTGGSFIIDVASLTNKDLAGDPENKGKLEGHLKSPDFFDVAKYPTAKFEITSVEPYVADSATTAVAGATHTIRGNLSLKDSTKNIAFPAKVVVDQASASASADFNIDRTVWGMNYKGPGNPQDWFISKEVNIKIALTASKQ